MISIIVAIANNYAIGKNNQLLCHLPNDLKRFKKITTGHTIIMGKNTFLSIGKPLPNRKNVVLSWDKEEPVEGVEFVSSLDFIQKYIDDENENFVIGGASIYKALFSQAKRLYITKMNKDFDGDVFFPEIKSSEWKIIQKENGPEDGVNDFTYDYITYERK